MRQGRDAGLLRIDGSIEADVARGLALRIDHGSQYLSDHFLNQIRSWGIRPSFGFVEEPVPSAGQNPSRSAPDEDRGSGGAAAAFLFMHQRRCPGRRHAPHRRREHHLGDLSELEV